MAEQPVPYSKIFELYSGCEITLRYTYGSSRSDKIAAIGTLRYQSSYGPQARVEEADDTPIDVIFSFRNIRWIKILSYGLEVLVDDLN